MNRDLEFLGSSFYCGNFSQSIQLLPEFSGNQSPIIKKNRNQFQLKPIPLQFLSHNPQNLFADLEISESQDLKNEILSQKYKCFTCFGKKQNKLQAQLKYFCLECDGSQYINEFHPFVAILQKVMSSMDKQTEERHNNEQIESKIIFKTKQQQTFQQKQSFKSSQIQLLSFAYDQQTNQIQKKEVKKDKLCIAKRQNHEDIFKNLYLRPSNIKRISEENEDQLSFQQKTIELLKNPSKSSTNGSKRQLLEHKIKVLQNSVVDIHTSSELFQDRQLKNQQFESPKINLNNQPFHAKNIQKQIHKIKYTDELLVQYEMDCSIELHYKSGFQSPYNMNSVYNFSPTCTITDNHLDQFNDYQCDICKVTPIKRIRYHCQKCQNYDLCQICYTYRLKQHFHNEFKTVKASQIIDKQKNYLMKSIKLSNKHPSFII